jgi:hypothetical protein
MGPDLTPPPPQDSRYVPVPVLYNYKWIWIRNTLNRKNWLFQLSFQCFVILLVDTYIEKGIVPERIPQWLLGDFDNDYILKLQIIDIHRKIAYEY